ncbi:hypothetical protein QVD99_008346 [Batrachochytrium dendrobatidis]|nr:hypothetical protein O5D80_007220 [Batrachochytrium dendrobatidis]KAK5664801.1 hypothetical protein QVD99_008346 [Batrachochytrium dendrobatidis]
MVMMISRFPIIKKVVPTACTSSFISRIVAYRLFSGLPLRSSKSLVGLTTQKHTSCDDMMLESVAETGFYSQHRPLAPQFVLPLEFQPLYSQSATSASASSADQEIAEDDVAHALSMNVVDQHTLQRHKPGTVPHIDNAEWYDDEYAKIFNSFAPFVPPSQSDEAVTWHDQPFALNGNMSGNVFTDDAQLLNHFFESFSSPDVSHPTIHTDRGRQRPLLFRRTLHITQPQSDKIDIALPCIKKDSMQLARHINIIKIRRKKMNKHKWKKYRRRVRNSSRYNKEKLRKSGVQRKKQD